MSQADDVLDHYVRGRVRELDVTIGMIAERMRETRQVIHQLTHRDGGGHPSDGCQLCDGRVRAEKLLALYAADYAVVAEELGAALVTPDEGSADE